MTELNLVIKQMEILWKGHELGEVIYPDIQEYPKDKIYELLTMKDNGWGCSWTEEFKVQDEKFRLYIYTDIDKPTQDKYKYEGWVNAIYSENQLTDEQRASVIRTASIEPEQLNPMDIEESASANLFNIATDNEELMWKELRRACQVIIEKFYFMMSQVQNKYSGADGWHFINQF